jgi:hypothetical protein
MSQQSPPPEHVYYDVVEEYLQTCIKSNRCDFLFDTKLFEDELRRLWEAYNFPYAVRFIIIYIFCIWENGNNVKRVIDLDSHFIALVTTILHSESACVTCKKGSFYC